jgi:hypothetical protein
MERWRNRVRNRVIAVRAEQMEGSAKSPPKGRFVTGVFYVAAKAATHKDTKYVAATLRG